MLHLQYLRSLTIFYRKMPNIKKQISSLYSDPLKWSVCKSVGLFLIGVYLARDLKGVSLDSVPSWFSTYFLFSKYIHLIAWISINSYYFWALSRLLKVVAYEDSRIKRITSEQIYFPMIYYSVHITYNSMILKNHILYNLNLSNILSFNCLQQINTQYHHSDVLPR